MKYNTILNQKYLPRRLWHIEPRAFGIWPPSQNPKCRVCHWSPSPYKLQITLFLHTFLNILKCDITGSKCFWWYSIFVKWKDAGSFESTDNVAWRYHLVPSRSVNLSKSVLGQLSVWMYTPEFENFLVPIISKDSKLTLIQRLQFMGSIASKTKQVYLVLVCFFNNTQVQVTGSTVKY